PPQAFGSLVKGRRLYDPRQDDTNGGSGDQRASDPTTWTWSNNAALCARDFMTGGSRTYDLQFPDRRLGIGIPDAKIDDSFTIDAANAADEACTVPIPVLSGTLVWKHGSTTLTGLGTAFLRELATGKYVM